MMLKIGITGGIGSGKSTISKIFEVFGIAAFYADDHAKRVMTDDAILVEAIKSEFGNLAYFEDGALNRKFIANIVFNDPEKLNLLNSIVHPAVFRAFDTWVDRQESSPYVLKEAALLFESGSYKMCDQNIMVYAPFEMRIDRVMQRDGISKQDVINRDSKQMPDEQKIKLADHIITNDESMLVIPQVWSLHQQFLTRSSR